MHNKPYKTTTIKLNLENHFTVASTLFFMHNQKSHIFTERLP